MNILHISTKDSGGAAIAAVRIHNAIKKSDIQDLHSKMLLLWDNNQTTIYDKTCILYEKNHPFQKKVGDYFSLINLKLRNPNNFNNKSIYQKYYQSFYYPENHELIKWCDIVHLHWVNGFVNPFRFFRKIKKPIVWTFHDMTPFSGGNPYESGIFKDKLQLFDSLLTKKRRLIHEHGNFYGHATTEEFKEKSVSQYMTFSKERVETIPNPLRTDLYKAIHKAKARVELKIQTHKPLLLFVAADTNNKRKGIQYLVDSPLAKNFTLLMAGSKNPSLKNNSNIIQLGRLNSAQLNLAYSAADLFVTPSIEEAFGQTAIESLYCGTPVVAFPTAGAKQILKNGMNGFIAEEYSSESLFETIEKAISHPFNCSEIINNAHKNYNPKVIAEKFHSFYNNIIRFDV